VLLRQAKDNQSEYLAETKTGGEKVLNAEGAFGPEPGKDHAVLTGAKNPPHRESDSDLQVCFAGK
jgi:hypothetical protein